MDIYPISFVNFFANIVTVSEQQKARPGKVAVVRESHKLFLSLTGKFA
jgi:hypothetical protein